jgi:hypothetical protein
MFNVIRKIFFAVVILRIIATMNRFDGPFKYIAIIALLFLGIRMVFAKRADPDDD